MLRKLPVVVIILSFLVASVFAQQATDAKVPDKEEKESVEKMAVAFLRETMSDVSAMRSAENRISFASEMAALMWFYDEKEARSMFIGVIADFRQLLDRYAAELHEMGDPELDGETYRGGFLSMTEPSARGRLMKKISTAVAVRQQIALSIAENDPDLAYSFFTDTSLAMESPEIQKMFASRDKYFESQLITQIAEKSPSKAVSMATKSLKDGFDHQHLELLRKLHAKDAEKAVEFGAAIISSLDKKTASYLINSLIDYGEETLEASRKPQGKKAVFTQSELRDLAEILAKRMLDTTTSDDDDYMGNAGDYLETVEKYAPNRAAQIRAKQKRNNSGRPSVSNAAASNVMTADAYTVTGSANSNANRISPAEQKRLDQAKEEQKLLEDIGKMGSKQLPKEEREKFIANARKVINQSQSRDKKVMALSALAGQVAALGDKELAAQVMKEAEALVNPTPKHYQDFLLTWMLASGYAAAEPDKAFPLLEETIGRANETIGAFIKVGEFIDVAEEMISDGEVQVGAFGGSMVRGLTKELGIADNTIRVLAKVDFKRTKELTNRFDRPEVRILAKMLVLRSVMNKKEPEADLAKKVEAATEK